MKELCLTTPFDLRHFTASDFDFFDKEGFELTVFEQKLYQINDIPFSTVGGKTAIQQSWNLHIPDKNINIDHSAMYKRYGIGGRLKAELMKYKHININISKICQMRPKLGLDISIEQMDDYHFIQEIFHYEEDFTEYKEFKKAKDKIEDLIHKTDWTKVGNELIACSAEWVGLNSDDQNDYKARYVGLNRSYNTKKVV